MAEQSEKEFAPGVYLKRQSFGKNKGEIIKQSINWEMFKAWAEENVNEAGYLNIDIKTSKNDHDKLYAELNTWVAQAQDSDDEVDSSEEEADGLPY